MFCTAELDAVISGSAIIALCGIIAENGGSGNKGRGKSGFGFRKNTGY